MKKLRESDIEAYLVEQVEKAGGITFKFTCPSERGVPDRIVILPRGDVRFIEVKRPGKRPTDAQQRQLERLRALGVRAAWVESFWSVDAALL